MHSRFNSALASILAFAVISCAPSQKPKTPPEAEPTSDQAAASGAESTALAPAPLLPLTEPEVIAALKRLTTSLVATNFRILAISQPVNGWTAVAIDPPYREFPNVHLFRQEGSEWRHVREGFAAGVQPYPSPYLDLHSVGLAVDGTVADPKMLFSERALELVALGEKSQTSVVLYSNFIHSHPAGEEAYFLDRRPLARAAKELYDDYKTASDPSCLMYDYTPLEGLMMRQGEDGMELAVKTRSGQIWIYGWSAVDERGMLQGRRLSAGWMENRSETLPVPRSETRLTCDAPLPPELGNAISLRASQARSCANLGDVAPGPGAQVTVEVQVDPEGRVVHARPTADSSGSEMISGCVVGAFLRPFQAAPAGSCTSAISTVLLERKSPSGAPSGGAQP